MDRPTYFGANPYKHIGEIYHHGIEYVFQRITAETSKARIEQAIPALAEFATDKLFGARPNTREYFKLLQEIIDFDNNLSGFPGVEQSTTKDQLLQIVSFLREFSWPLYAKPAETKANMESMLETISLHHPFKKDLYLPLALAFACCSTLFDKQLLQPQLVFPLTRQCIRGVLLGLTKADIELNYCILFGLVAPCMAHARMNYDPDSIFWVARRS